MIHSISLIIATKDRPDDLRKLLESLRLQTAPPREIVIVDASVEPIDWVTSQFHSLPIRYLRHWPPSASAQRNAGIRACGSESTLLGFADDDSAFEPNAFEHMLRFWQAAGGDVLGASFNIRNYPPRCKGFFKHSRLAGALGLYSTRPGSVSPSGWQAVTGEVAQTQFVEWIPSGAVIFRRSVFDFVSFDEVFESYSYLEDLDFSYTVGRMGKLAIVADAGYFHFPSNTGRVTARQFGRFEVRNRLYFVRKHCLSLSRCYLGLAIRLAMSAAGGLLRCDTGLLTRALGNAEALIGSIEPRSLRTPPALPQ